MKRFFIGALCAPILLSGCALAQRHVRVPNVQLGPPAVAVRCADGSTFEYIDLPPGAQTCADTVWCSDDNPHRRRQFETGRAEAAANGWTCTTTRSTT